MALLLQLPLKNKFFFTKSISTAQRFSPLMVEKSARLDNLLQSFLNCLLLGFNFIWRQSFRGAL